MVAKVAFSDVGLRGLKPPAQGQLFYWDKTLPRFGCRLSQGGSKTFLIKHRNRFITIGRFPTISLSQARTEAKRLLAEFTLGKVRPQSITYKTAVELFLEEKEKVRRSSTVAAYKGLLNRLNFSGQLSEITGEEVRRKLKRSNYNHYLVALKVFFSWCIKRRYIEHDPTLGLSQHRRSTRARVLTDDELRKIWKATEDPTTFNKIVRLLILTGQRKSEIAALAVPYYSDNQQTICLPSEITKNHCEHLFPVASMGIAIIHPSIVDGSPLIFPARGNKLRPFSGWSKSKKVLDKASGVTGWRLHDIRRTYRSLHGKIGTPPHIAERLLNHVSVRTEVDRTYDRHTYLPEMRAAVDSFESYMKRLLVGLT